MHVNRKKLFLQFLYFRYGEAGPFGDGFGDAGRPANVFNFIK
jgi:hypothetical protein